MTVTSAYPIKTITSVLYSLMGFQSESMNWFTHVWKIFSNLHDKNNNNIQCDSSLVAVFLSSKASVTEKINHASTYASTTWYAHFVRLCLIRRKVMKLMRNSLFIAQNTNLKASSINPLFQQGLVPLQPCFQYSLYNSQHIVFNRL
jgi:hypothetical protein